MSISVNSNLPAAVSDTSAASPGSTQSSSRVRMNASIMQASLDVSISTKNEPLALLYKSAINSLNDTLKTELGENAIQNAASQDNTPEGTAGRIVSLSTGFYEAYKTQNPEVDETTVLQNFMETIRSGFEKGYKEAVDILQSLKVFDGDIAANVEKTYQLVIQGYADFEAAQTAGTAETAA